MFDRLTLGITHRLWSALLTLFLALGLPVTALAAGGEASIKLEFSDQDKIYLYISLAFALISIGWAFAIRSKVKGLSAGNEKMQEVGNAIREGALAYLRKQVATMSIFVGILAVGLFFLYQNSFGTTLAIFTSLAFVGGVAASYIAGYTGMDMAVMANMRTAHAALTSYKKALETAFQAGAVAGLITVGMGLLGATLIFLLAGANATKLLVGFGFGGSLAALFMRVGGGIFTKAADVGADLVGKVEAGIPEDDPRNPAVIADNVGDNVGDCAGMAADVFESYEVTLVAAIVLGAATAAIFPQEIWIQLVLFAMMARGVGIIASIAGVSLVKGSDSIDFDPLKAIRRGFYGSAVIAAVATFLLAFWMLGDRVKTDELVPTPNLITEVVTDVAKSASVIARENGKSVHELEVKDLEGNERITNALKKINIPDSEDPNGTSEEDQVTQAVQALAAFDTTGLPKTIDVSAFRPVDFEDEESELISYAVPNPDKQPSADNPTPDEDAPDFITFGEAYGEDELVVMQVQINQTPMPQPETGDGAGAGDEAPTPQMPPQNSKQLLGPDTKENLQGIIDQQVQQGQMFGMDVQVEELGTYPVKLYANGVNDIIAAVDFGDAKINPTALQPQMQFVKAPADLMNENADKTADDISGEFKPIQPTQGVVTAAIVRHKAAPWWRFALCVLFGIFMAFVFEWLTDYYVGLHKKPVQELGQASTAGPAPMIISGFAYGKESSVFSVFAIVACLIAPLLIFPPSVYDGYLLSFYGIALVGLGLLTTTGFILAMDTFGPISDNAQGVFEMSGAHIGNEEGARRVQLLDAAGNTTKALTKGFAIATAVVAAVALFHAYVDEGQLTAVGMRLEIPEIFLGLLIGGAAPYLFSAFSIQAVGRAAFELINEVRRQFREDPGIMAGTSKPDYARCVGISTSAAQKELLSPGLLAIFFPVIVAFGFAIGKETTLVGGVEVNLVGAQALGGFLAGTILSGQLMAVLLANSGGMWDNAKKLIEDGLHGGKGTEAHTAAVVCDTVGDPFKDTAGPALNPLIKVMNLVALLLAPIVIVPHSQGVLIGVTLFAAVMLTVAIAMSKKGSIGSAMGEANLEHAAEADAIPKSSGVEDAPVMEAEKDADAEKDGDKE